MATAADYVRLKTVFFSQRCPRERQRYMNEQGNRRMALPLGVVFFGFW